MNCYFCVLVPYPQRDNNDEGLSNIYKTIPVGKNNLYKVLVDYMIENNTRYIGLYVPRARPEYFKKDLSLPFHKRFPESYVHDFESLIAQSDPNISILCVYPYKSMCEIKKLKNNKDSYESALLSFFIQSVHQINPTSRILYEMQGFPPKYGCGKFITSDTNQCCFKKLVAKMVSRPSPDYIANNVELILMVEDHVKHTEMLNVATLNKWLCWGDTKTKGCRN